MRWTIEMFGLLKCVFARTEGNPRCAVCRVQTRLTATIRELALGRSLPNECTMSDL